MHKQKSYHCSVCGAEMSDQPVIILRHELSHVQRRRRAVNRAESDTPSAEDQHQQP
jgi:hypothetical protein